MSGCAARSRVTFYWRTDVPGEKKRPNASRRRRTVTGKMAVVRYVAVRKFGPHLGEFWNDYVHWTGRRFLQKVVTLNAVLCPPAVEQLTEQDWQHNVHEDYVIDFFRDLDYVLSRVSSVRDETIQILAVISNPESDVCSAFDDDRFVFHGYDLVDRQGGVSALTNCSGIEAAFAHADISPVGLVESFSQARTAQQRLRELFPNEHHADCNVWAIWRMSA
jgi:hypothetical protein